MTLERPMFPPRRAFLAQAAVVAAGGATLGMVLPLPVSAGASERVPDPILAAIEAHKSAWTAEEAIHRQFSAFEEVLADNGRLQYERRTADETRRTRELEAARDSAFNRQQAAAIALLGVEVTTLAGLLALLQHVQKYDDDTYGEAWPTHLVDEDEVMGTRPWHYYLVANLIRDLPAIMRGAV